MCISMAMTSFDLDNFMFDVGRWSLRRKAQYIYLAQREEQAIQSMNFLEFYYFVSFSSLSVSRDQT